MRKKVDPFAQDNSANAVSDRLTYRHRVDQFGRAKVFNGGKLALLGERFYHSRRSLRFVYHGM